MNKKIKKIAKYWSKFKKTRLQPVLKSVKRQYQKNRPKVIRFLRHRPFVSFTSVLALLLLLIIIGNLIRAKKETEPTKERPVKQVSVFAIGQAPTILQQGKVEKSGTITVAAQVSGIVHKINVYHGQEIGRGFNLLQISSNYQGASLPSLQQSLALQQYQFNADNLEKQKEIIRKQKELAEKSNSNSEQLREFGRQAVEESRNQLDLNETILSTIETNLNDLKNATQSAENDALILSTQQLQSQFLAAVNQLKQLIRTSEYQSDDEKSPAEIANLQKDITFKQLEIQEKSLDLSLEVSRLNYQIARVGASLMLPTSPFKATVERVHVRPGQLVSPGQPLVTLSGANDQLDLVIKQAPKIAQRISRLDASTIFLPSDVIKVVPQHVTLEPVLDGQHRVIYHLPEKAAAKVFDGQFLKVEIPLGYADSVATIPSIPLDAVYQLQKETFVYLAEDQKAVSQKIVLGQVLGSFVEVLEGIKTGDLLITSRNVNQDDQVTYE